MIDSGLSHLTAVSGANCAIIVAAIMLLGGVLRLSRRLRVIVSLIVLVFFVVVVTPSPSVLRAAVMAVIVLFSLASGRAAQGIPALALATIILLSIDPWLSRSYGLALSVLSTGGLLLLTRPLAESLSRWIPRGLAIAIAVPLAAQIACQPVLLLLSPHLSSYSVLANLLAEPAAPVATVVGLVSCVVGAFVPAAGVVGAWIAWVPASWIAAVATFFAELPGASLPWLGGIVGIAILLIFTALVLFVVLAHGAHKVHRLIAAIVVMVAIGGYTGSLAGTSLSLQSALPENWQIAACDIGQGDAVVVRQGESYALVDVGPDPALLRRCLDRLSIHSIDLLVLTHYDLDHVGGLSAVLGQVSIALIGPAENDRDQKMARTLTDSGADVRQAHQGDSGFLGDLPWQILWPRDGTDLRGNPASITIEFEGVIRSIFLGDLGEGAQRQVMMANHLSDVDVVKVAHHGSADQSEDFYRTISAEIGIVSVGADNRYGHPTDKLLDILARTQTTVFRTDLNGLIVLAPSEAGIVVWSEGQARLEPKS